MELIETVSRRSFIGSVVGVAVAAGVGGFFGGSAVTIGSSSKQKIDPVFGFTGLTPDTPAPRQAQHEVQFLIKPRPPIPIPEFFFQPTGLFIQPGETVKWVATTPDHTVTAYHAGFGFTPRVPDGVPPFSSPVLSAASYWLYTFEKEGVYDIYCAPHQILGMVQRIVVGSASGPGASPPPPPGPEPERPPFPPILTAALVLRDPALDPSNIMAKGSVQWDEVSPQNKMPLVAPIEGGPPAGAIRPAR